MKITPIKLLGKALNTKITVKLKNGSEYVGILEKYDVNMNLVITDASEVNNGISVVKYGRILIRGNNILYIKLDNVQVLWI
ncbi:MAG: hypothetical protein N3E39_04100 [Candidatus Methanomethylicia archaeon]|nr:hypothetical protein [Candidatus Methanomethylicia archaeon]